MSLMRRIISMKIICILFSFLALFSTKAFPQVGNSYFQGVLEDTEGLGISNTFLNIKVSLSKHTPGAKLPIKEQNYTAVSGERGVFIFNFGDFFQNLELIDTLHSIDVSVSASGYEMPFLFSDIKVLANSPYAYYASIVKNVESINMISLKDTYNSNITVNEEESFLTTIDGTWTASTQKATDIVPLEDGKVEEEEFPQFVRDGIEFLGTWDAELNEPSLLSDGIYVYSGFGANIAKAGDYFIVKNEGSFILDGNGIWKPEDVVLFDGTLWIQIKGDFSALSENSIYSKHISNKNVLEKHFAPKSITQEKIQISSIDSVHINSDIIVSSKIADKTITSPDFAADAITIDKLAPFAVGVDDMSALLQVMNDKIANNSIENEDIKDSEIKSEHINERTIRSEDIGFTQIGSNNIDNFSIGTGKFSVETVSSEQIEENTVTTDHIINFILKKQKLKDSSIISNRIENFTIIDADFKDGSIDSTKISNSAIQSENIYPRTIGVGVLANTNIASSLKIIDKSVKSIDFAQGAVGTAKIKDATIESANFSDLAITGDDILDNSLIGRNFSDAAITENKLADSIANARTMDTAIITTPKLDEFFIVFASAIGGGSYHFGFETIGERDLEDDFLESRHFSSNTLGDRVFQDKTLSNVHFDALSTYDSRLGVNISPVENTSLTVGTSNTQNMKVYLATSNPGDNTFFEFYKINSFSDQPLMGTITENAGTVLYSPFTGAHRGISKQKTSKRKHLLYFLEKKKNQRKNTTSEPTYLLEKKGVVNAANIAGVGSASHKKNMPFSFEAEGNSTLPIIQGKTDIKIGDYLISSDISGYAVKDEGTFEQANIIGRTTENINWENIQTTLKNGLKYTFVDVYFTHFVTTHQNVSLQKEVELLEVRLQKLRNAVEKLEKRGKRLENSVAHSR